MREKVQHVGRRREAVVEDVPDARGYFYAPEAIQKHCTLLSRGISVLNCLVAKKAAYHSPLGHPQRASTST